MMALPILAAEILGMPPDDFRILYQDTDAGPYDGGASGSQTTFNNGRAVIAAANDVREQLLDLAADHLEADRADLELVDGTARVKGSPDRRSRSRSWRRRPRTAGCCSAGARASHRRRPMSKAESCVGRLGGESFAAPTFFTHAVRVKVDRDTGVVRVLEVAAAHEFGHDRQPDRRRRPDPRRRRDGHRAGADARASLLSDDGRQRNPYLLDYKLQTVADVPPIRVDFVDAPSPDRRPARASRASPSRPACRRPGRSPTRSRSPRARAYATCP